MSAVDLRKKAFSNNNLKELNGHSGSETNTTSEMFKTDSEVNLTKPSLYGIYKEDSFSNFSNENLGDESEVLFVTPPQSSQQQNESNNGVNPAKFAGKVAILTLSCLLYNEITKNIHIRHSLEGGATLQPVHFSNMFLSKFIHTLRPVTHFAIDGGNIVNWIDIGLAAMIQGVAMGAIHPLMDALLPAALSKRLLSSAPQSSRSQNANLFNDLVRSLITFLGISYGVRKIEWASTLQVSLLWSLLNPCLWLLLDGTINGFLASSLAAFGACVCVYFQNFDALNLQANKNRDDFIATWLWVASFFFCGLIIFGKLGRGLFGK
ncbi:hypothetical protein CAAN1_21S02190 [[Candida] anglica]|uniref:Uncharacterized protein n=1 Tax=[Candida] anglica TaxID=148631 RepID=A0ABP0EE08_9ASCO